MSVTGEMMRRIVLSGVVREEQAAQFLEQITSLEWMDLQKPITIYIDTYGGSVDSAILMYDAIKSCVCPIVTIGIGKVMSAGVLLLAAGDKRFITENTRVMIHEASGTAVGPISEMKLSIDEWKRQQDVYISLLSKDTGQPRKKILDDIQEQAAKFMTAAEAVEYGIVDAVVPTKKVVKDVDKPSKKKKSASKKNKK